MISTLRVTVSGTSGAVAWAEGMRFTLPAELIDRAGWGRFVVDGRFTIPSDLSLPPELAPAVREVAAFTESPPATSKLPVSYQRVPARLRAFAATLVGRRQRRRAASWARFPAWPLDLTADLFSDLAAIPRFDMGDRTPVLLTHDIDSAEGLASLVANFLPIEERAGARSANYIVPCAWRVDDGLIAEVRRRGHEIGVHGYDHSNRTPFVDAEERRRRLDAARSFQERFGARGYRAPSLLRTRALLRDLATRYQYDSSIPTSGGPFPVPNNGCATARPFWIEGALEIPLTLPRDGSLRFLGHSPSEILTLWKECGDAIAGARGVVVLLTHCEARFSGNPAMLESYAGFIEYITRHSSRFVFTTPATLAARLRDAGAV